MSFMLPKVIKSLCIISSLFVLLFAPLRVIAADEPPLAITTIDLKAENAIPFENLDKGVSTLQIVDFHAQNLNQVIDFLERHPHDSISASFAVNNVLSYTASFSELRPTINNGMIMMGSLQNSLDGTINLVITDGIVNAILTDNGQQYQLKSNQFGQYQFETIDQNLFPTEAEPIIPTIGPAGFAPSTEDFQPVEDSAPQIDVMVVYTDDARIGAGGTTQMVNLINLAVTETNQGYARSNVYHRFNLVHTQEVDYNELNGGSGLDWSLALTQLTNTGDGYLDEVQSLRDFYYADLVIMIVEDDSVYCGMGWLMTSTSNFAPYGFSIVARTCATGYYSFGHESGHNMGAHHDRVTTSQDGMYPYSHGYLGPNYTFRTIMAYPNGSPRINNWSNPLVFYNGQPTGVDSAAVNSADNSMTLNNTAPYVVNFRVAPIPPDPPSNLHLIDITSTSISLEFTDNSYNEQGFKLERAIGANPYQQIALLPANLVTYQNLILDCGQSYSYRVRAYNTFGDSNYSNVLNTATLPCVPPPAPSPVHLFITMRSVTLSWQDVEGETSYVIEQFYGSPAAWNHLATLSQNATTYYLDGLTPDTTYTLRVNSKNDYGVGIGDPISFTTMNTAIFFPLIFK